jgi:exodeoxyribonuclease VII small subunit
MNTSPLPVEQMNYEQASTELESIITILESSQTSLEETVTLFERGQALAQRCGVLLDQAELRVKTLSTQEFEDASEEEGPGE